MTMATTWASSRGSGLPSRATLRWLSLSLSLLLIMAAVLVWSWHPSDRQATPLRSALADQVRDAPVAVEAFYRRRRFEPLWAEPAGHWLFRPRARLIPEAKLLATRIATLLPERRRDIAAAIDAARGGDLTSVAHAELLLSLALGDYRHGLHQSIAPARLAWLDPALAPPHDVAGVLEEAARAPSPRRYLDLIDQRNPIYHALRQRLAEYRSRWARLPQQPIAEGATLAIGATGARVAGLRYRLGLPAACGAPFDPLLSSEVKKFQAAHGLPATGQADSATQAALNRGAAYYERLIRANLERARAFPTSFDGRFLFVNVAAARLSLIEQGGVRSTMRVVAGSPAMQTPAMAGLIRYAEFNPYWNFPVDLVRARLAPQVLRHGPVYLRQRGFEALSDWSAAPRGIDVNAVDWRAVAQGHVDLRVRQRPGQSNEMGRVKFMMPNEIGIYLHDTPHRALFGQARRWVSAGCVRLENADMVTSWLLGSALSSHGRDAPSHRVDLSRPTPVYIGYLTAAPTDHGIAFYPDVYGRDPALLAALGAV